RDREYGEPMLVDEKGILVGPVSAATILHDPQTPDRSLLDGPMVEEDHTVGDVLLEALPRELPLAALPGDHGGQPLVLQPTKQPSQLCAQDRGVREAREERLDRVEHDPLGSDFVDGELDS